MNPGKLIKVGDFAMIIDEELVSYGIPVGAKVYLAGEYLLPFSNDPYNYRKIFIAALLDSDGHIQVMENGKQGFTVDPTRLELLSDEEQEALSEIRDKDFAEAANDDEAAG